MTGRAATFMCVDCPDALGLLAKQPGVTDALRETPCLPQCSVPQHHLVLQREVSKSLELLYVDVIIHV